MDGEREARVKAQTELAEATRNIAEQKKLIEQARSNLADAFRALSSDALKSNNEAFLTLARKTLEAAMSPRPGATSASGRRPSTG